MFGTVLKKIGVLLIIELKKYVQNIVRQKQNFQTKMGNVFYVIHLLEIVNTVINQ